MLHEETLLKINTAIRQCLDRCYSASDPLAAMAECLDELRESPEWRLAEVDEVECTVRRILQAVVTRRAHEEPHESTTKEMHETLAEANRTLDRARHAQSEVRRTEEPAREEQEE